MPLQHALRDSRVCIPKLNSPILRPRNDPLAVMGHGNGKDVVFVAGEVHRAQAPLLSTTIALATWRRFPWYKVPGYIISQLLGGLIGAAILYANYFHAIDVYEGGRGVRTLATAGLFGTYGADFMTNVSCFFSEVRHPLYLTATSR